jgi:hypothetical protein
MGYQGAQWTDAKDGFDYSARAGIWNCECVKSWQNRDNNELFPVWNEKPGFYCFYFASADEDSTQHKLAAESKFVEKTEQKCKETKPADDGADDDGADAEGEAQCENLKLSDCKILYGAEVEEKDVCGDYVSSIECAKDREMCKKQFTGKCKDQCLKIAKEEGEIDHANDATCGERDFTKHNCPKDGDNFTECALGLCDTEQYWDFCSTTCTKLFVHVRKNKPFTFTETMGQTNVKKKMKALEELTYDIQKILDEDDKSSDKNTKNRKIKALTDANLAAFKIEAESDSFKDTLKHS